MKLAILGSGFIGRFYADSLVGQRRKDTITMVYSRTEANAEKFAKDYNIPNFSTNMLASIEHHDVDTVIIALSNNMHLEAILACAKADGCFRLRMKSMNWDIVTCLQICSKLLRTNHNLMKIFMMDILQMPL